MSAIVALKNSRIWVIPISDFVTKMTSKSLHTDLLPLLANGTAE